MKMDTDDLIAMCVVEIAKAELKKVALNNTDLLIGFLKDGQPFDINTVQEITGRRTNELMKVAITFILEMLQREDLQDNFSPAVASQAVNEFMVKYMEARV